MRTSKMIIAVAAVVMMAGMSAAANAAPWRGHHRGYVNFQVHIPVPHIYIPAPPVVVNNRYDYQQGYTPPCNNGNYNTVYYNNSYHNNYRERNAYRNDCHEGYRGHSERENYNHYNYGPRH